MNKEIDIPGYGTIEVNSSVKNTEDYFLMAVRKNNKKRNFLFVSQLLGKHIPIKPDVLFDSCAELSAKFAKDQNLCKGNDGTFICEEKTLIIGFAETATAMGHAVFDCFSGNCNYVHTTRNKVSNYEFAFEFKEEHCHAPEQLFFLEKEDWIKDANNIIIVDDEVTTGNTIKNIISQINQRYPQKSYSIITFLDWRNDDKLEAYSEFESENKLDIQFYSFVQGNIENVNVSDNNEKELEVRNTKDYCAKGNGWFFHDCNIKPNIKTSAENGMSVAQRQDLLIQVNIAKDKLKPLLKGKNRAIIGTGEFMYIPLLFAKQLPDLNYFNATTRSPVIANNHNSYGIKKAIYFNCPTDTSRNEYLYNSNIMNCDEVVLFMEKTVDKRQLNSLLSCLDSNNYSFKHVVFIKGND